VTEFAQAAESAVQLSEYRATARELLGDAYFGRMEQVGAMVSDIAAKKDISILAAGIALAQACQVDGRAYSAIYALAATVELMTPSPDAPPRAPESEG
jgi:hypothetical protein